MTILRCSVGRRVLDANRHPIFGRETLPEVDWSELWSKAWPVVVAFFTGTLLGNVKTLFEIGDIIDRRKTKIVIHRSLSGHRAAEGNYVFITNLSSKVILITYWSILWRKPWWHFTNRDMIEVDSDGGPTKTIQPNEEIMLSFNDDAWFNPFPKNTDRDLYFRFMVTGEKRPREKKLSS